MGEAAAFIMSLRPEFELRRVYESCAPSAFVRARELLGSEADAWDVVQKVFCRLAESDLLAEVSARPMAYVYRATTNACLNELKARRVRAGAPEEEAGGGRSSEEAIHARDLLEKLDPSLDDLDRQILVLGFYDGLPQEKIAEVLGVWRRTIGRRLNRLRALVEDLEQPPLKRTP